MQSLHLQAPVSSPMEPAVFDSAAVRDLQLLQQLSLGRFAGALQEPHASHARTARDDSCPALGWCSRANCMAWLALTAVPAPPAPADFQLEHLPSSLRRLRLAYDGQTRTLSMACLPDHITKWVLRPAPAAAVRRCRGSDVLAMIANTQSSRAAFPLPALQPGPASVGEAGSAGALHRRLLVSGGSAGRPMPGAADWRAGPGPPADCHL